MHEGTAGRDLHFACVVRLWFGRKLAKLSDYPIHKESKGLWQLTFAQSAPVHTMQL
jgi:hypothetical protein